MFEKLISRILDLDQWSTDLTLICIRVMGRIVQAIVLGFSLRGEAIAFASDLLLIWWLYFEN